MVKKRTTMYKVDIIYTVKSTFYHSLDWLDNKCYESPPNGLAIQDITVTRYNYLQLRDIGFPLENINANMLCLHVSDAN